MQDPSTSTPSPRPTLPPHLDPTWHDARHGLHGYRIVSGTGEDLGRLHGIENDRHGAPKKLSFLETDDAPPRYVPIRYVRHVENGVIHLAGPRQGYHITRVGNVRARAMPDAEGEDAWGAT